MLRVVSPPDVLPPSPQLASVAVSATPAPACSTCRLVMGSVSTSRLSAGCSILTPLMTGHSRLSLFGAPKVGVQQGLGDFQRVPEHLFLAHKRVAERHL